MRTRWCAHGFLTGLGLCLLTCGSQAFFIEAVRLPSATTGLPDSVFRFRRVEERRKILTFFRQGTNIIGPIAVHGLAFVYEYEPVAGQSGTFKGWAGLRTVGTGWTVYGAGVSTDTRAVGGDEPGGPTPDLDASVLRLSDVAIEGTDRIVASVSTARFDSANPGQLREIAFVLPVATAALGGDFGTEADFTIQANWNWGYNQGVPYISNSPMHLRGRKVVANYDTSIDTRKINGQPDVEGQLPGDPNAEPSNINFGQWKWKGGLFFGRVSPIFRDQSGTARLQLKFPAHSPTEQKFVTLMSLFTLKAPSRAPLENSFDLALYMPNATDPNISVGENQVTWETKWDIAPRRGSFGQEIWTDPIERTVQYVYEGQTYQYTYRIREFDFSKDWILKMPITAENIRENEFISLPLANSTDPNYEWDDVLRRYKDGVPGYPNWCSWEASQTFDPGRVANWSAWQYILWLQTQGLVGGGTAYTDVWRRVAGYREVGLTNFCMMMRYEPEALASPYTANWRYFSSREFQADPAAQDIHRDSAPRLWYVTYIP